MDIYEQAVNSMQGNEIDHHQSDLYLKVNEVSKELVNNYEFKNAVKRFRGTDKSEWFDIPFAYSPYWMRKF